jgi:hypothetical protein
MTAKQFIEYLRRNKRLKKSKTSGYYYAEIDVKMQGISVKLFFSKVSKRGKWHGILTIDSELNFDQVFKISRGHNLTTYQIFLVNIV